MHDDIKRREPTPPPTQPIIIGVDPRLEAVADLPGGDKLYKMVRQAGERSAKALNDAVLNLLEKHELPNDVAGLKAQGYELMINTEPRRVDGKPSRREVVLYKMVEKFIVE